MQQQIISPDKYKPLADKIFTFIESQYETQPTVDVLVTIISALEILGIALKISLKEDFGAELKFFTRGVDVEISLDADTKLN